MPILWLLVCVFAYKEVVGTDTVQGCDIHHQEKQFSCDSAMSMMSTQRKGHFLSQISKDVAMTSQDVAMTPKDVAMTSKDVAMTSKDVAIFFIFLLKHI